VRRGCQAAPPQMQAYSCRMEIRPFGLTVGADRAAGVCVDSCDRLSAAVAALALPEQVPVIVVVGGAAKMSHAHSALVLDALVSAVAPAAAAAHAVVVDGGTDSGIMRLTGTARTAVVGAFQLVGVVVERLALGVGALTGADAAPLEPQHTHFVLVPGETWGDEAPWIAATASAIARDAPSVTVLANGGEIAWRDVRLSVDRQRPVVVLTGSGRAADEIGNGKSDRARQLHASGLIRAVPVGDPPSVADAVFVALRR